MDKIRANIPRPSPYERPSAVPFISQEALEIAALPYEKFIRPAFEGMKRIGGKLVDAAAGRDVQYTSEDLAAFADTLAGPGMLAGPSGAGVVGVIRQPEVVAKHLRKLMQSEIQARGKASDSDVYGQVLRLPMYRGQATIPTPAAYASKQADAGLAPDFIHGEVNLGPVPTMEKALTSTRHIGEPGYAGEGAGVSVSLNPDIAVQYSKRPNADDYNVSRVMPLFGGKPESVVLNPVLPGHQDVLRGAYENAALKMIADGQLVHPGGGRKFTYDDMRKQLRTGGLVDSFNKTLTENLQQSGYKGVLHAPRRSGDFELQMFSGKDLLHVDERPSLAPELQRLWRGKPDSDKPGPHKQVANKWLKVTEGDERGALNKIYKKIDLDALFPEELR